VIRPAHSCRRAGGNSESAGLSGCVRCCLPPPWTAVASEIGCAHQLAMFALSPADDDQPRCSRHLETFWFHTKRKSMMPAQLLGISNALLSLHCMRRVRRFVATEGEQEYPSAILSLSVAPSWSRRLSAGHVPAGVVHDLELVQFEEHDTCVLSCPFWRGRAIAEAVLELAAVQEPGKRIVARRQASCRVRVRAARYIAMTRIRCTTCRQATAPA